MRYLELEDHLTYECPRRYNFDWKGFESRSAAAVALGKQAARKPRSRAASPEPGTKSRPKSGGSDGGGGGSDSGRSSPGKGRNEVYQKVSKMSTEVAESLRMLGMGDRAWTSNIGSRTAKTKKGKASGAAAGKASPSPSRSGTPASERAMASKGGVVEEKK
jgi:hypothetical protein